MQQLLPLDQIRTWLKTHQRRLKAGDELPFMTDIAKRAGVHRDTIYALLNGEPINIRSQYCLTKAINQLDVELVNNQKTRLMNISIGSHGIKLGFGMGSTSLLR